MTTATLITSTEPTRHALAMPDCDCGMCAPTWARRKGKSKKFTQPVTLLDALAAEDPACPAAMVDQHRQCLTLMSTAASQLLDSAAADDPGCPEVGLALLMFAGELASALEPRHYRDTLTADQIADCEHAITGATLAAAGCLTGLVEAVQLLAQLLG
jgi:hypothetical protein